MKEKYEHSEEQVQQVNQILRCAFLVAGGDNVLSKEERQLLQDIRPYVHRLIDARAAVEHFQSTGNLDTSLEIFPTDTPNLVVFGEGGGEMMLPDIEMVPPFLDDLFKKVQSVTTEEELIDLERQEALIIKDKYLQSIAIHICVEVAKADGEFSEYEAAALEIICQAWEIDMEKALLWIWTTLQPVISGESISDENRELISTIAEADNETLSVLNEVADELPQMVAEAFKKAVGEAFEESDEVSFEDDEGNIVTLRKPRPVESDQNSFLQACTCIFLAAYGGGDINDEEIDGLTTATNSLSRIYAIEDDDDPMDYTIEAQNIVNEVFEEYDVIPLNILLRFARESAKKITDQYLQKAVGLHALFAADADDELDEEERKIILIYLDEWGLEQSDLQDVEDDFN